MPSLSSSVAAYDPSERFFQRLMAVVAHGQRLDDPRDSVICRRWVEIVEGIPDGKLFQLIPQTVRRLFKDPALRPQVETCGLRADVPLRIEAIAPYVVSFRRFMAARTQSNADDSARAVIAQLRQDLRHLKQQFDQVFDHAAGIEAERDRLSVENRELRQQVLSLRLERDTAQRQVADARSKAFRFLRLYLFMLKEELQRRNHDPLRMATVEVAIETNLATLEALGWQDQALRSAQEILGADLYAAYFDGGPIPDPTPKPTHLPRVPKIDGVPYFPLGEMRGVTPATSAGYALAQAPQKLMKPIA